MRPRPKNRLGRILLCDALTALGVGSLCYLVATAALTVVIGDPALGRPASGLRGLELRPDGKYHLPLNVLCVSPFVHTEVSYSIARVWDGAYGFNYVPEWKEYTVRGAISVDCGSLVVHLPVQGLRFGFWFATAALAVMVVGGRHILRHVRQSLRHRRGACPHCGYDVSAVPGADRCPECGSPHL